MLLETNYLVPDPGFLLMMLVVLLVVILLPLVSALRRGRYGWALLIVLFPPPASRIYLLFVRPKD